MANYLEALEENELLAIVQELDERFELFSAEVRMQINDELRRRRLEPVRRIRYA